MASIVSTAPTSTGKLQCLAISVAAAVTAASAAHASTLIAVPVRVMFMGWVAFSFRA